MQREADAPAAEDHTTTASNSVPSFATLGLGDQITRAIAAHPNLKFSKPTLVQTKVIPLALEGRDVLARSRTGSGKTAAYLLPIIEGLLRERIHQDAQVTKLRALILVPTKELAAQVTAMTSDLTSYCRKQVRVVNLAGKESEHVQRASLGENPDIVVATPARAKRHLELNADLLSSVRWLVVDEVDLVLGYDGESDLKEVKKALGNVQTFLMSATLTHEVEALSRVFCRSPAVLRLEEEDEALGWGGGVTQYIVKCAEEEKFLLSYVIFKLNLVKGKCIIFVADIDRCYRLKLFFEQFGIRSCVLNSELPVNSRLHIVSEFNKSLYTILIATDEHEVLGDEGDSEDITRLPIQMDGERVSSETQKKRKRKVKLDKEYGVSRGIDFKNISCVLNFDLPSTSRSYTHRIGRTARAGASGIAISFVVPSSKHGKHRSTFILSTEHDEKVLSRIKKSQAKKSLEIKDYQFDMDQVNSFRYRMEDALRAVTRTAIREARTRELRMELIASEKLKRHFEENPDDLRHLRHDGELRAARTQAHLKHIPEYLIPKTGSESLVKEVAVAKFRANGSNRIRKNRRINRANGKGKPARDPLKTFRALK